MRWGQIREILFDFRDVVLENEDTEDLSWQIEEALGRSESSLKSLMDVRYDYPEMESWFLKLDEVID